MVFYNSNYENITEAKPNDDGLVVIGVMIQVCRLAIIPIVNRNKTKQTKQIPKRGGGRESKKYVINNSNKIHILIYIFIECLSSNF